MTDSFINIVRDIVHISSMTALFLIAAVAVLGLIKPVLLRRFFKEFCERKYIFSSAVFIGLLCATVFVATQSPDIKHESSQSNDTQQQTAVLSENSNGQQPPSFDTRTDEKVFTEPVPYTKRQQTDPSMPVNQSKMTQAGSDGQKSVKYLITTINGKEISKEKISEEITVQPVEEIIAVGSKSTEPLAAAPPQAQNGQGQNPGTDTGTTDKPCRIAGINLSKRLCGLIQ